MIKINITTELDGEVFDAKLSGMINASKVEIYRMLYTLFNSLSTSLDASISELYDDFGDYLLFKVTQDRMKGENEK